SRRREPGIMGQAPPLRTHGTQERDGEISMGNTCAAVLKTTTESVLAGLARPMEMAALRQHLAPGATTILKDNISWHFPFPGANTTPWQLEGTIQALRAAGYADQGCV